MDIKKERFQSHTFYTLKNNCGLEMTFCNYGASIYAIKYKGHYVTYHEDDYVEFLKSNKYGGKTLGRVAGRIKDGVLKIKNKTYHLDQNEEKNTLHGGKRNLSFRQFATTLSENESVMNVVFKYTSLNGECGFPHKVRFIIVYSIMKDENKFSIHYHAITDGLTPISLAPHIYWRLKGKDILNHNLMINANEVTKLNKDLIISGKEKVSKIYDFRKGKKIGDDIKTVAKENPRANGYDCGFVLNKTDKPQVVLKNDGIKLSIKTDMNMAIVFTNCYPSNHKMKGYGKDIIYGGVAIEPQMYAPNLDDKLIDAEHPFDRYISFHLEDY